VSSLPTDEGAEQPSADARLVRDRSTPGWVKVLGIIVLVLLVAFLVSRFFGIEHGPGLHSSWIAPDRFAVVHAFLTA
jgi:hypothetical protein